MKVTRIETLRCDAGWRTFSFLKVMTDEGIVGWSEYNESFGSHGLSGVIEALSPVVIGKDPRDIELINAHLRTHTVQSRGGINRQAVAAIENALLDIKGKALGVPVYELFGGAVRERMQVYWSRCGVLRARCADMFDGKVIDRPAVRKLDDLKGAAREARERGFKAVKTNLLLFDEKGGRQFAPGMTASGAGFPELNVTDDILAAMVDQLSALREGGGPTMRLLLDLNFNYKPEGLKRIAKALEPDRKSVV